MDPSGLALLYIRTWEELFRSDYPRGILAPPYACADAGNFASSTSRHADLIVDSDVLKNTVFIKTVEVSSGAPLRDAPRDAPCDAPRDTAFHFTVQAPYPKTFAPLPGYLPTRRPRTHASSRKAAWAAPVPARCISQCISQSIVNMCVQ